MEVTFEKLLNAHYTHPPFFFFLINILFSSHPPFLKIQHKPTATMLFILTKRVEAGREKEGTVRKDVKCGVSLDTSPLFLPHTQELLNNLKDTMYSTRTPSKYLFLSGSKNTVIMNMPWLVTSLQVTELWLAVPRPVQCLWVTRSSTMTFLAGSTPPGKGKAKHFISTFQTLQSESPV